MVLKNLKNGDLRNLFFKPKLKRSIFTILNINKRKTVKRTTRKRRYKKKPTKKKKYRKKTNKKER
jgi:hypothetical protein